MSDNDSNFNFGSGVSHEYVLSDNVVEDLIRYTRSKTIKNEQQFVLTFLGYISGHMADIKHYTSGVLIGTAGSGKSHLQNTVAELIPEDIRYDITTSSKKAIIYDRVNWNAALVANMDELQKPDDDIIEILKSVHGGEDGEFVYKVTGGGEGADRETDDIVLNALPYWFLYAQYEPDFEMWDRLIKIPVHESSDKNDGVARTHWGYSEIKFGDDDKEYTYDFIEGTEALKNHVADLPRNAYVEIPAGQEEFGGFAFYDAIKNIFDIDRSETNRVSSQIANLVRASALLNHKNRDVKQIHVNNEGIKDAIIAEPQDLANVMACREVLMATTHQLDAKRQAICVAINEVGGTENAAPIKHPDDRPGQPKSIMGYLRDTNASFVKKSQIIQMLKDLEDNGLVEKLEGAGDNGRNLYQFTSWQELGKFDIDDDFKAVFDGTVDPFEERPFIETAREINDSLTPTASDFDSSQEVSSRGGSRETSDSDGQMTLGGEPDDDGIIKLDLAAHEKLIHELLKENLDGELLENLDEHDPSPAELLGLVPIGEPVDEHDLSTTLFNPEHEVWAQGPKGWVESKQDASSAIEQVLRRFTQEGVMKMSTVEHSGGEPVSMRVTIEDVEKK